MSTRHSNSYSAINMFYNGGWALSEDGVPAIWKLDNLDKTGLNSYKLDDARLNVSLTGVTSSSISQNFSEFFGPTDFVRPLSGGEMRGMAAGYNITDARLIAPNIPLTVSFDVKRETGDVSFFVFYTAAGEKRYASVNGERLEQRINLREEGRLHFVFNEPDDTISEVGIEMSPNEASIFSIDKVMLAPGANTEQPYTGDPFIQIFPEGCIVLTLGESCPPGFAEMGEDSLSPMPEWLISEPGANARKGNYPRSGDDLSGSPLHTTETPQVQDAAVDRLEYESKEGRLWIEFSDADPPAGQPIAFTEFKENSRVDEAATHSHDIEAAKTRPASIGMLFCRRL